MKPPTDISDDEIRSYMDFDGLLEKRNTLTRSRYRLLKWSLALLGIASMAVLTTYLVPLPGKEVRKPIRDEQKATALPEKATTYTDTVSADSALWKTKEALEKAPISKSTTDHEEVASRKSSEKEKAPHALEKDRNVDTRGTRTPEESEADPVKENVYTQAEPVAGYDNLYLYLDKNINYPAEALKDSVQGVVTVSFVINVEGVPEHVIINNSLGPAFEVETLRLIKQMPAWKPATLNGKAVPSKIVLPVTYTIRTVKP